LYRGLVLALVGGLVGLLWGLHRAMPQEEEPDVEMFDVPARFEAMARERPEAADQSETFFFSETATVHMHVMGFGQTCPMHLHRKTHEVTVIVSGRADVRQVWGEGGAPAERSGTHGPGELIASPPYTGHAWFNRDEERMLGNLVFATPPFQGNLYVREDDRRLAQGAPPFVHVARPALAAFAADAAPSREEPLPVLEGRMSSLLLKASHRLEGTRRQPLVVYVLEGQGALEVTRRTPMRPGQLWVLRRGASVHADAGAPLALYVFRPPPEQPEAVVSSP
jgi:mannose-6-phosphate isomerase-like protein (cupin superfamily)